MEKQKHSTYKVQPSPLDVFLLVKVDGRWETHQPWLAYEVDSSTGMILDFTFLFNIKGKRNYQNDE